MNALLTKLHPPLAHTLLALLPEVSGERARGLKQTTKLMMEEVIGRSRRFGLRGELESWRLLAEERESEEEKKRGEEESVEPGPVFRPHGWTRRRVVS